jgi:omega-6 fatty acid desaturase (delta-12 desaturase)
MARGIWQIVNTLVPYVALWVMMYYAMNISYWLLLPLIVLAGGFLVRVFIIFHDCGHSSFFKSQKANHILGSILGVLEFTPYFQWRWEHAIHHSTSGNLDRRGIGDVWIMTVKEYLESSKWKRVAYRFIRNPIILFGFGPLGLFFIKHRFSTAQSPPRERKSVFWTNIGVLAMTIGMSYIFGFTTYLILQASVMLVAGSLGIWLFYVQHQFEGVYWERSEKWDYLTAALEGSSFYKLPKILQWFSGNIGFHHIHHLGPRIPNYNLEKCHKSEELFQEVPQVTLWESLKAVNYRLYDEENQRFVGFGYLKMLQSA